MNVLADKHHAGLFRSLQLLADRLGWTLYTPTGLDWWERGYWRFGEGYGDDRLARQFLTWTDPDPEYPDMPIRYVTLDQAQAMDWAYVIATVPDNEDGLARFAREHGTQFVVQVGNTGQYVNWGLDPLVLSSSEMPILGRGVVYHQEMEPIAFSLPTDRVSVASFVNCMPSMGRCWDVLEEAQKTLPIHVYGIDGPDGVVKPYAKLVERMRSVGWGWHDKAQGDGFGHVIHSWAAVGRPIIGHASHYAGKLAESFWQDGFTCIDLDRHSVRDAVDMVLTMHPDDHRAMCRAIRLEFERQVDYAAEAGRIADLLGLVVAA